LGGKKHPKKANVYKSTSINLGTLKHNVEV